MRRIRRTMGMAVTIMLAVTACTTGTGARTSTVSPTDSTVPVPDSTLPPRPDPSLTAMAEGALVQFDACETFLDYVISHAVDLVGPYGFEGSPVYSPAADGAMLSEREAAEADDGGALSTYSGTNVQVEGVDEPDMVKTDGERIVLLSEGELIVVDVTGDEPVEIGRVRADDLSVQSLFLSGDKVIVFGSVWKHRPIPLAEDGASRIAPEFATPTVQILEIDISGEPEIVRMMTIDGAFVSGRMVEDSVRLVLTSSPVGFEWSFPEGSGLRAEREAIEKNREIVRNSTEDNWIPYYIVTDSKGDVTDEGKLFDCNRAAHPVAFSGLDMLSVVTIDLSEGLEVRDATGVLATGNNVYASEDNLYVATQNWQSWVWFEIGEESERPDGPTTEIHKFDISRQTRTEYLASGSVKGYLLNQFAMDEHEGMLRVATTTTPNGWGSGPDSESRITVLREIGEGLVPIGMVDGLGETEQIYSVRFMGDVGYVVTFRQVDPLYTVDLSDPRRPEVQGELKIPGYSAYLHPVGESLLMGVGQDATDQGVVQGTQVSVFDVSDLADPTRLDTFTLSKGTSSEVEYDHHAFLYWDGLVMIPIQRWTWDEHSEEVFMGIVGLRVRDDGTLSEVGQLTHPGGEGKTWDGRAQILRSIVIGESVYTISHRGIMKSSLDDLDQQAWLDL